MMMGFVGLYVAAQWTPAGWVADGIAVVTLVAGAALMGKELSTIIDDIKAFVSITSNPSGDLDQAADHLARAVAAIGVDTLLLILTHKAASAAKPFVKPPSGFVDMVTNDGTIVRVPADAVDANASMSKSSEESGGGSKGDPTTTPDPATAAKLQARDTLATEKGKVTPKGRSEADTVLQAIGEGKVRAPGEPRRINLDAREPDHDFAMEKDGKVTGYVEIKTPVAPRLRPVATQAAEIASKISELRPDTNLQILVDLKNLETADKGVFLQALIDNGLDLTTVTILNK
jgi:hypothetical protein